MMNSHLKKIKSNVYNKSNLSIEDYQNELESKEYDACRFNVSGRKIICRSAKITPKKIGQFVTFWKRNLNGTIQPLNEDDKIDFYVVNVSFEENLGQFVFPKSVLIKKGILSTHEREGKRGFRVYPAWDTPVSKQAKKTQKWQLDYFLPVNDSIKIAHVNKLYETIE